MKTEIRFAGFGGQGIKLAGEIVGHAASIHDGKNAVLTQNYGPEARGGASAADVIISDTEIDYPKVAIPDILVVMSQEAYTTYGKTLKPGGLLIIDEDLVKLPEGTPHVAVPCTRLAEEMGKRIVANIVMVGFFASKVPEMVSTEAIRKSLLESIPKGTEELNTKAFEAGFAKGRK